MGGEGGWGLGFGHFEEVEEVGEFKHEIFVCIDSVINCGLLCCGGRVNCGCTCIAARRQNDATESNMVSNARQLEWQQ